MDSGIIYKKRGVGMFVKAGAKEKLQQKQESVFRNYIVKLIAEAERLGISPREIIMMIERVSAMSIEITGVSKSFGPVAALKDVSLSIAEGKIYGLLGRNGAGKSTLLNIITNRLFADSGTVLIDGEPAAENDRALGKVYLMSEKHLYPEGMKVANVLKWSRHFYPDFDMDFALTLAEKFGLNLNKKVKALSREYSSILKIIVSLSVNVPYVLLDELGAGPGCQPPGYVLRFWWSATPPACHLCYLHPPH